jgi:hypothetical protein
MGQTVYGNGTTVSVPKKFETTFLNIFRKLISLILKYTGLSASENIFIENDYFKFIKQDTREILNIKNINIEITWDDGDCISFIYPENITLRAVSEESKNILGSIKRK